MRRFVLLIALLGLSACAMRFPVEGRTDKGEVFKGEGVASVTAGTFSATSETGVKCSGKYDQYSTEPTLALYVTCDDGRHGRILAHRDASLVNGEGTGKLSDGTQFDFKFGNKVTPQ